jgi:hypothetical protein
VGQGNNGHFARLAWAARRARGPGFAPTSIVTLGYVIVGRVDRSRTMAEVLRRFPSLVVPRRVISSARTIIA